MEWFGPFACWCLSPVWIYASLRAWNRRETWDRREMRWIKEGDGRAMWKLDAIIFGGMGILNGVAAFFLTFGA